jgi:hypothetical protein
VDVRFYYTTKRIEKRGDGRYVSKDRNNLAYNTKDLTSQFAHCYDISEPTLMITIRFGSEFSKIQICPWFLRKSRGFKFTNLVDLHQFGYSTLSRLAIPIAARTIFTPIDSFLLTDKVIVHELTHTTQGYPSTIDISNEPYGRRF